MRLKKYSKKTRDTLRDRVRSFCCVSAGSDGLIPSYASEEIAKIAESDAISLKRVKELEMVSDHDTAA